MRTVVSCILALLAVAHASSDSHLCETYHAAHPSTHRIHLKPESRISNLHFAKAAGSSWAFQLARLFAPDYNLGKVYPTCSYRE